MFSAFLCLALAANSANDLTARKLPLEHECPRSLGRTSRNLLCGGPSFAFFEFAPTGGSGLTATCACTAITGAKGETITATRGSTAYCTKEGIATTGLTNTSMVLCGNDLPRVESDGTVSGLLVEKLATNVTLQSEAFDNAAWTTASVTFVPTVTANAGTSPANSLTADRIDFAATSGGQSSAIYQIVASNTYLTTFYVRGVAGVTDTGTIDVCWSLSGAACTPCAFTSASWTRCARGPDTTTTPLIGNVSSGNGGIARGAQSVLVWGAQAETGSYATSYIATTSAAATRAADDFLVTIPGSTITNTFSFSGKSTVPGANTNARWHGSWGPVLASSFVDSFGGGGGFTADSSAFSALAVVQALTYPSTISASTSHDGTSAMVCLNGTCNTAARVITPFAAGSSQMRIGAYNTLNGPIDGVISRVCLDPSPTRCR